MKKYFRGVMVLVLLSTLVGCSFGKSVAEGISVEENGISANKVYLSDGHKKLKEKRLKYGQKIFTNFEDLEGFTIENDRYYPQMSCYVVSKTGDTVLQNEKLYYGDTGFESDRNTLFGELILATPISSGQDYTIYYNIVDERGSGTLQSEMDITLVKDDIIKVDKNGLDFKEAYIMSQTRGEVITDAEAGFDQELMMDFQQLSGYTLKDNRVVLGLSIKVTDASGNIILDNKDAFKGQTLNEKSVKEGVASTLSFSKGAIDNPILWQVKIWDKNGSAELLAEAEITIK